MLENLEDLDDVEQFGAEKREGLWDDLEDLEDVEKVGGEKGRV